MPVLARPLLALLGSFSALALTLVIPAATQNAKPPTGEALFAQRCAGCHGAKGEGGKAYPQQLSGTLSTHELSGFIHKSMPPGPQKCPTADADKIAAYMYQAFFSPAAQARNQLVRVHLDRLNDRQFRNAVAERPHRRVIRRRPSQIFRRPASTANTSRAVTSTAKSGCSRPGRSRSQLQLWDGRPDH